MQHTIATIAVIFDFDDTLAPDSTSGFLQDLGVDVKAFWQQVKPLVDAGWDPSRWLDFRKRQCPG